MLKQNFMKIFLLLCVGIITSCVDYYTKLYPELRQPDSFSKVSHDSLIFNSNEIMLTITGTYNNIAIKDSLAPEIIITVSMYPNKKLFFNTDSIGIHNGITFFSPKIYELNQKRNAEGYMELFPNKPYNFVCRFVAKEDLFSIPFDFSSGELLDSLKNKVKELPKVTFHKNIDSLLNE